MRAERKVTLDGREVTVRELTVGEVRQWLQELTSAGERPIDLIAEELFAECSLEDLARMSELSVGEMDGIAPSELRKVVEAAKALNPDFFALRGRLVALGRRAQRADSSA